MTFGHVDAGRGGASGVVRGVGGCEVNGDGGAGIGRRGGP